MAPTGKQRFTGWLNAFLLIINVSALVTILLLNRNQSEPAIPEQFSSDEFLRRELNLTDEQYKQISEMDAKIFRVYQNIIDMQCEEQFKILNELSKDEPNLEHLDSLAMTIGRLHMGLKRQTIKHFMNIKSVVTDEQEKLLDQILIEMMEMNKQCQFCNKTDCDRREQLTGKK